MNTSSFKILFVCLLISYDCSLSKAVPAHPGKITVTQPDGFPLTLRLIGDEYGHVTLTDDNYAVCRSGDSFYYIQYRTDGQTVNTGMLAHEPAYRSQKENLFVQSLSKNVNGPLKKAKAPARKINTALLGYRPDTKTGRWQKQFPLSGKRRTLILLVQFDDIKFHYPDSWQIFHDMLNKTGYREREHIGCARDYFYRQSMGAFDPQFDVYGPFTASRPTAYYGQNDENGDDKYVWQLVLEACAGLDDQIDFSNYDLDHDGIVDNVYIYFAGHGANFAGASSNWIWPHAFYLSEYPELTDQEVTFDGVKIDSYGCCAEMYGTYGDDLGAMGTFCHEFGHILGLPDFYDTNYELNGLANHPDQWDIMASGSYLPDDTRNTGAVPAGYTAMERSMLGWGEPVELTRPQQIDLPSLQESNRFLKIGTSDPDEYYLLENRQQTHGTYDQYLPSHGLLIYHVDQRTDHTVTVTLPDQEGSFSCAQLWNLEYNSLNANADHMCLEIEKASGNQLGKYGTKSSEDTPFPGRQQIRSFTDETNPSMKTWEGTPVNKPVTDITESNGIVSFNFMGGGPALSVRNLTATNVVSDGFTLQWTPVDGITAYKVYLWTVTQIPVTDDKLLDTGFSKLPDGWSIEGEAAIENGALRLGADAATGTLITPVCDQSTGGKLTLSARQYTASGNARLTVRCGDYFSRSYSPTASYSNMTFTLPENTEPASIRFETKAGTKVMIDRVTFTHDGIREEKELLPDYPLQITETTAHRISGLEPLTLYACAVEAVGLYNSRSEEIKIATPENGVGLTERQTAGPSVRTTAGKIRITCLETPAHLELYNSFGEKVFVGNVRTEETEIRPPVSGMYILRLVLPGGKTIVRKIIFRS